MSLQCKRIHDPVLDTDGKRILVDRDMPTDLNREEATLNSWYRDVAPSKELYDWYDQDPAKLDEFKSKYKAELDGNPMVKPELDQLVELGKNDTVTLLCSGKRTEYCHGNVLKDYLEGKL